MADKRPPKIGEFQERYTGKKTPKWLLDAYIQGSKSYNAKELKHKIIGYAEKNNLLYPQVVAQARGEANQIKNYLKKTVTPSGKNKARKPKVSGGGGMFNVGDTASSINRGTLSVAKKRQMNKGGLTKKAKK